MCPTIMCVIVLWSKTLQDRRDVAIPVFGTFTLCPVRALRSVFASLPAMEEDLLFVYNKRSLGRDSQKVLDKKLS